MASSVPASSPTDVDESAPPRCACLRSAPKVMGIIVLSPIVLALIIIILLMRHLVFVAVVEFILIGAFVLNGALHAIPSPTSTLDFASTAWDVLLFALLRTALAVVIEYAHPWPSTARRVSFTLLLGGVIAFYITKLAATSTSAWMKLEGGGHAALMVLLIGAIIQALSQFWVVTSKAQLQAAQDKMMAAELRDHYATPADRRAFSVVEKLHSGISYYLVDELPLRSPKSADAATAAIDAAVAMVSDSKVADPSNISVTLIDESTSTKVGGPTYGSFAPGTPTQTSIKPILVVLHGFFGGKGIWVPTFGSLAKHFRLVVLDIPGVGLCDRPRFTGATASDAEIFFASALERFRLDLMKDLGLPSSQKVWVLGHSYGGYIAADYALRYPHAVETLLLASPVGLPHAPPGAAPRRRPFMGPFFPILMALWGRHWIRPQSVLRFLGPFGALVVRKAVSWRFEGLGMDADALSEYLYHLNASPDSGNATFTYLLAPGVFARSPLRDRMLELKCPTHFIYGQHDWMDPAIGREVSNALRLKGIQSTHHTCPDAGHQLFMENPSGFYHLIVKMSGLQVTESKA